MQQILLASTSENKKLRIQKLLQLIDKKYEVFLPTDLNIEEIEIVEGDDVSKNAELKAMAYFGRTTLPIVGYDQGLEIEGENLTPALVKRNALRMKIESKLSQAEISDLITNFYIGIANNHGGEVKARWLDAFFIVNQKGQTGSSMAYRPIILTNKSKGMPDLKSPITNLYKVIPINKYVCDLTAEEDFEYRQKMIQSALLELLDKE